MVTKKHLSGDKITVDVEGLTLQLEAINWSDFDKKLVIVRVGTIDHPPDPEELEFVRDMIEKLRPDDVVATFICCAPDTIADILYFDEHDYEDLEFILSLTLDAVKDLRGNLKGERERVSE